MKKIFTLFLALSIVLTFAACSTGNTTTQPNNSDSTAESTDEAQAASETDTETAAETTESQAETELIDLEVTDFSYYVENGYLMYAIKIHNPNTDTAIELPSYRITAKSSDGSILGNEEQTLSIIYPGQDFVFASQAFSVTDTPADTNVQILAPDDYNITKVDLLEHPEFIPLTVENASVIKDDFFTKITGEIKNDNDYDIDSAHLCVIFRDSDGNVASVESTYVDNISAGGNTPFELSVYSDNITDTYEAYANIWF